MGKEITLEELARSNNASKPPTPAVRAEQVKPESTVVQTSGLKTAKPISTSELGKNLQTQHPEAQKKVVEEDAPLVADAFAAMNKTLAQKVERFDTEVLPQRIEKAREEALDKELDELESSVENPSVSDDSIEDDFSDLLEEETTTSDEGVYVAPEVTPVIEPEVMEEKPVVKAEPKVSKVTKTIDEDDEESNATLDDMMKDLGLDVEEEEIVDTEEETAEELRERFKASLSNIKITRNPVDLSQFQIAKDPVSSATILSSITATTKKRCDHPLLHTKRNMTFEECSGPELDSLRKTINNSNGINGVIASLRFVYNHNVDANKVSFEAWCKSIRTEDIESLYFGMYKACYGDTNLVARVDAETEDNKAACNKTSLVDTPIAEMLKFKDDEAKELYNELMNQDTTNPGTKVKSNIMAISDNFVVSYTEPTLYSTFIQYATLKPEITRKYSDQLNTMAYIDGFYSIDYANNRLVPIAIKEYPNNINKTVMSKLKTYTDILKTLSNDQYNVMVAKLDNVIGESKISYIYPETTCPECGNTISEEPVDSMLNLLFTRAQLVQVKSL